MHLILSLVNNDPRSTCELISPFQLLNYHQPGCRLKAQSHTAQAMKLQLKIHIVYYTKHSRQDLVSQLFTMLTLFHNDLSIKLVKARMMDELIFCVILFA